ncbi:hypothetical protein J2X52_002572 [Luteimonas sp. 3794]|nr:hypothetical protein [Luteimonas sp. 3794]
MRALTLAFVVLASSASATTPSLWIYSYTSLDGLRTYVSRPPHPHLVQGEVRMIPNMKAAAQYPVVQTRPRAEFRGYSCTSDCSGHHAGYEWARTRGISYNGSCSGNSQSFIEGCWAWVEEQAQR